MNKKQLLGNEIIEAFENEFDVDDSGEKVGQNMVIIEPKSSKELAEEGIQNLEKDAIEDYIITRESLKSTLDQAKHILKAGTELFQENPNPNTLKILPDLILAINKTSDNLFNNQIKISKQIKEFKQAREETSEPEETMTTAEFLKKNK